MYAWLLRCVCELSYRSGGAHDLLTFHWLITFLRCIDDTFAIYYYISSRRWL